MSESFVVQLNRLRAARANPPLRPFLPHAIVGELERRFMCAGGCGFAVWVGPCFEDVDPESFVCGDCLVEAGDVETGPLPGLSETAGQDGTGSEPVEAAAPRGTAGNGREADL